MPRTLSRRDVLKASGLAATMAALAACDPRKTSAPTAPPTQAPPGTPVAVAPPASSGEPRAVSLAHALRRLTFGPTPAMRQHAEAIGLEAWLSEQFDPTITENAAVTSRLASFTTLTMSVAERVEAGGLAVQELIGATLARQRFSDRQVYEMLVDFWSNHFSIYAGLRTTRYTKTDDDLHALRPNALGTFRDLLWASAHSPAMLAYLDQATSTREAPNENYARELLELHTVGVEGGYTQRDVEAVARALTGWSLVGPRERRSGNEPGTYIFRPDTHDDGAKQVMELALPAGGGKGDGERLIEYLAAHPSTARFVATKLARRFVADFPPPALIEKLAAAFQDSRGDVPMLMRTLVLSEEFAASAWQKLKRPLEFVISALRVTEAEIAQPRPLVETLRALGQIPFNWPAPNGYPDVAGYWLNTSGLLARWNFALTLAAGKYKGAQLNLKALTREAGSAADVVAVLGERFTGEPLPAAARDILIDFASADSLEKQLPLVAGLILGSPYFQWR
jgi:uncharacterized protein (DUF1800 family)